MITLEQIVDRLASLTPENLQEVGHYVDYLRWKQGGADLKPKGQPWQFDFVEHFRRAVVTADHSPAGMEVQIGEAACNQDVRMALWQHPPVHGSAIVEYQVPVPPGTRNLRLYFSTGIRDGSKLAQGNVVAFRIFVNDWRIWSDTQHLQKWIERELLMPALPGDVARIQFVTDGLGNHQWAWAAWGEPKLIGEIAE